MKKNITVNMLGVLYNIDEDAYGLLNSYLNGMRDYFARIGADEEVAQDVEYRVGELMAEVKERGSGVITIEDVRVICERVGSPEQMGDGSGGDMGGGSVSATGIDSGSAAGSDAGGGGMGDKSLDSADGEDSGAGTGAGAGEPVGEGWYDGVKRRRLYRDERKKWLGGVLAGVASYAGGGDPVPWRIAFVLLCIVGGPYGGPYGGLFLFLLFAYVLLWAFLPVAATPEDRLRQRGCEVNAQSVHNEILNEAAGGGDGCASGTVAGAAAAVGGAASGGGEYGSQSRVVKGCFAGCLALPVGCFALLMIMTMTTGFGVLASFFDFTVVVGLLSLLAVVVIPVVALLHALFGSTSWSVGTRVSVLVLWLVALLGMWYGIYWGVETLRDDDGIGLHWQRIIRLPGVSVQMNSGCVGDNTLGTDSVGSVSVVVGGTGVRVNADSADVRVGGDSLVVRVNVKDNKGLPEDSAVEVFPEEAE